MINVQNINDWYAKASVKKTRQPYPTSLLSGEEVRKASRWHEGWLKEYILPVNICEEDVDRICTLQMIHFLKYTEELERHLVIPVLQNIVDGKYDRLISTDVDLIKSAALRIYTDEAYHASYTFDAYVGLLKSLDIKDTSSINKTAAILDALKGPSGQADPMRQLVIAFMSESNVTSELAKTAKSLPEGGFKEMIADHLADEQSHVLFFNSLLGEIMANMNEVEKKWLAECAQELMGVFYKKDIAWLIDHAKASGVSDDAVIQLKKYKHENIGLIINEQGRSFINLLKRQKVLPKEWQYVAVQCGN